MRGLLLAATGALLAVVLVGCGQSVDTAKVTYQRTTVPAGQGGGDGSEGATATGEPRTNDPAFTTDKLRTMDPCGLLTKDILSNVGDPVDNDRGDFAECSNYMKDSAGDNLSITLTLGDNVSNAQDADQNIGGLPAIESELDSGDACFVTVVTATQPNVGIAIQAGGEAKDLCKAGRTVMTGVVDLIRTDPPAYEKAKGTLIDLDPCDVVKDATLRSVLGSGADAGAAYNLHWCNWHSSTTNLGVWLRLGYDPAKGTSGQAVPLGGGVTGYQSKTTSSAASCELQWAHRRFSGDDTEIVHIFLDKQKPKKGEDPCKPAVSLAKTLITTLPKA
ncbi:MAG TPA: DUF3558 family protein [Actinophytocola sp.]|nr:DUF3558 family protein [Actinophytocola sp.]